MKRLPSALPTLWLVVAAGISGWLCSQQGHAGFHPLMLAMAMLSRADHCSGVGFGTLTPSTGRRSTSQSSLIRPIWAASSQRSIVSGRVQRRRVSVLMATWRMHPRATS